MRAFNKYFISLTILFLVTTVALAVAGEDRLDLYASAYVIEYLVVTLFFTHLNPAARRGLNIISLVLLLGFGVIVLNRVLDIVAGVTIL